MGKEHNEVFIAIPRHVLYEYVPRIRKVYLYSLLVCRPNWLGLKLQYESRSTLLAFYRNVYQQRK